MKSILVTGGSGYLGSILVPKLKEKYPRVAVLDHNKPILNNIEWFYSDIINTTNLYELMKDFDAVIHLAAIVGDKKCDNNPRMSVEVNYLATKKLAQITKELKKKMIFASTCSIYGVKNLINTETDDAEPFSIYGLTKLKADEEVVKAGGIALRMGTLYGYSPKMRYDLAVNSFVKKGYQEGKIIVFGGKQMRPFLNINDAAEAFQLSLEKNISGSFNIADKNITVLEIAKKITKITGATIKIEKKIQDKRSYIVSTKKAEKLLGFKPKSHLTQTVKEICQYL